MSLLDFLFPSAAKLTELTAKFNAIDWKVNAMSALLDTLGERLTALETVGAGMAETIRTLRQELIDNKTDPEAIQALIDRMDTDVAEWTEALVVGTAAEDEEPTV